MKHFAGDGPRMVIKSLWSDNAGELIAAAEKLLINNPKSTPHESQRNAIIERRNRQILEGTRTLLDRAGVPAVYWPHAARHFCMMHNVTSRGGAKDSPYWKRFKRKFAGKLIPFGARCEIPPLLWIWERKVCPCTNPWCLHGIPTPPRTYLEGGVSMHSS